MMLEGDNRIGILCYIGLHCWHDVENVKTEKKEHGPFDKSPENRYIFVSKQQCCWCGKIRLEGGDKGYVPGNSC